MFFLLYAKAVPIPKNHENLPQQTPWHQRQDRYVVAVPRGGRRCFEDTAHVAKTMPSRWLVTASLPLSSKHPALQTCANRAVVDANLFALAFDVVIVDAASWLIAVYG